MQKKQRVPDNNARRKWGGRGGRPGAGTSVQQGRVSDWNLRRAKSGRRRGDSGLAGRKSPRGHRIPGQVGTEDAPDQRVWTRFPSHRARLKRFVPNAAAGAGTGPRAGTTGTSARAATLPVAERPPSPGKGAAPGPPPRQAQRGQSLPSSRSPPPGRPTQQSRGALVNPREAALGRKVSVSLPPWPLPVPVPVPAHRASPTFVQGAGNARARCAAVGGWQQPGGANRWAPASQGPAAETRAELPGRSAGASPATRRDPLQLRA